MSFWTEPPICSQGGSSESSFYPTPKSIYHLSEVIIRNMEKIDIFWGHLGQKIGKVGKIRVEFGILREIAHNLKINHRRKPKTTWGSEAIGAVPGSENSWNCLWDLQKQDIMVMGPDLAHIKGSGSEGSTWFLVLLSCQLAEFQEP